MYVLCVESVTDNVYLLPLRVTVGVILSPGETLSTTWTSLSG
jgi:hypothetical protein